MRQRALPSVQCGPRMKAETVMTLMSASSAAFVLETAQCLFHGMRLLVILRSTWLISRDIVFLSEPRPLRPLSVGTCSNLLPHQLLQLLFRLKDQPRLTHLLWPLWRALLCVRTIYRCLRLRS